jgi:hypothetical protein
MLYSGEERLYNVQEMLASEQERLYSVQRAGEAVQ